MLDWPKSELGGTYSSSMFGWKMRFTKPMLGDLYGYWSGSSTCTFHVPPSKGAMPTVSQSLRRRRIAGRGRTLCRAFEPHVKLLPGPYFREHPGELGHANPHTEEARQEVSIHMVLWRRLEAGKGCAIVLLSLTKVTS